MASQMEWSHEFCLSCDRQLAEGGAYCSQACRLADLEKAGTNDQAQSNLSSSASSTSSSQHGFYLPPAVNFSAYKTSPTSRGFDMSPSTAHYYSTANSSYFAPSSTTASSSTRQSQQQRSLTPSSSRSSLASAGGQTASGISPQAAHQLNSYVRSFDQVRDMKRRYQY